MSELVANVRLAVDAIITAAAAANNDELEQIGAEVARLEAGPLRIDLADRALAQTRGEG